MVGSRKRAKGTTQRNGWKKERAALINPTVRTGDLGNLKQHVLLIITDKQMILIIMMSILLSCSSSSLGFSLQKRRILLFTGLVPKFPILLVLRWVQLTHPSGTTQAGLLIVFPRTLLLQHCRLVHQGTSHFRCWIAGTRSVGSLIS